MRTTAGGPDSIKGNDGNGPKYLQFTSQGYRPSSWRRKPSASDAFLVAARGGTQPLAHHVPVLPVNFFLENQTLAGGFKYTVDPELVELLSLIDGRCGFEVTNSERLTVRDLEDHIFLRSAALFKRSRDGIGSFRQRSIIPPTHTYISRVALACPPGANPSDALCTLTVRCR